MWDNGLNLHTIMFSLKKTTVFYSGVLYNTEVRTTIYRIWRMIEQWRCCLMGRISTDTSENSLYYNCN